MDLTIPSFEQRLREHYKVAPVLATAAEIPAFIGRPSIKTEGTLEDFTVQGVPSSVTQAEVTALAAEFLQRQGFIPSCIPTSSPSFMKDGRMYWINVSVSQQEREVRYTLGEFII